MKIGIYGATGMVGSQITAEALRRGHEVTALSRKGTPVAGAIAVAASLDDLNTFQGVAARNDAVVIAIPPPTHRRAARALPRGTPGHRGEQRPRATLRHRRRRSHRGERGEAGGPARLPRRLCNRGQDDVRGARALPRIEALRWTMLAPAPMIAPGERTGKYRLGKDSPAGERVSTQDFAVAVLDELESPRHANERFTVAS